MLRSNKLEGPRGAPRRILFITRDALWNLISPFLVRLGCACWRVSSSDLEVIVEREKFDAVLLEANHTQIAAGQALLKIEKVSPSLLKRTLVIQGSHTNPQTIELVSPHTLLQVADKIQIEDLWEKLEYICASSQSLELAPPKALPAQLVGDNLRPGVPVGGMRGPVSHARHFTYQHETATIDLLITPKESSRGFSITGQVLDRNRKMHENGRLPVLLITGQRKMRTSTNPLGEFSLECESVESMEEDACIEMRLGEGTWVSLPIGKMFSERAGTEELDRRAG